MHTKPEPISLIFRTMLKRSLFFSSGILFCFGCSQNNKTITAAVIHQDSFTKPQITQLSELSVNARPKQALLDLVPKPQTIAVPFKPGANYIRQTVGGPKKIILLPPVTHLFRDSITNLPIEPDGQGRGFFTTYTTDNGLAYDEIDCGFKDQFGNLWFGTDGQGVSKFDGTHFTTYTTAIGLASNVVKCIAEDKDGNLWFGTDGNGVSKYDGRRFINYSTAQGLVSNLVYGITSDKKGNIWFATIGGVSKYDGKRFTNFTIAQGLVNNSVRCIMTDHSGNLWFGSFGGGVTRYDGKQFTNITRNNGLAGNSVVCMIEDRSEKLWFGSSDGGVSLYDGHTFSNFTTAQGLGNNSLTCMLEDQSGILWFGTFGGGVSKYDGRRFTNYSTAQGLTNNAVQTIIEDKTGNLWFGTYGGGLSQFAGKSFINYTTTQGLASNQVWSITQDKNSHLWFGTDEGGVSQYDGNGFTNYTVQQGLAGNIVYCTATDRSGNLWFGTSGGGVSKFDGKRFTNYTTTQGLAGNIVFTIAQDKMGNLWFGTSGGGISEFDGKRFTNYTTTQGLAGNVVYCISEDKDGNLWFGTHGGGVSRFDGKSFINFTTSQGLASNVVWTITQNKDGDLWFGTQEGLSRIPARSQGMMTENDQKNQAFIGKLFENLTTKEGLPDNFITQVVEGSDDHLYVGTNSGICELSATDAGYGKQKQYVAGRIFSWKTGYPVKDVNVGPGAMFKDSKGIIWIGTGSDKTGLVRFDPGAVLNSNAYSAPPFLQSVKINNQNLCWNDLISDDRGGSQDSNVMSPNIFEEISTFGRPLSELEKDSMRETFHGISLSGISKWYPIPQGLVLPYRDNHISFDFNVIETGSRAMVKYQYKLEGYDKDWSPPQTNQSASFGNIYEGDYTFKLRAQSTKGVWSELLVYSFKVLPPAWRTWWMYLIYSIGAISIILGLVNWNNRRIIAQQKILKNKIALATMQLTEERDKVEETLTELKNTQALLIQSEKMASLGALTAGIAHEIQNPLNFVNNFSELSSELLDEMKSEMAGNNKEDALSIAGDIKLNLEKILHHGQRADAIVKSMLQHSRTSTGSKEPTDINALVEEFLSLSYQGLLAKDKLFSAKTVTSFDPAIGNISLIPQDIGRVILNLCNNAFYAVTEKRKQQPEGYEPTVSVSTKKLDSKVEIVVKDNGNGISTNNLDKIFQPFFTTKPTGQGTGLGLSLSYDIIKAHGGELKASTKGEGVEFVVLIPS